VRIADCGLRIADCGLRIADCGLRIVQQAVSLLPFAFDHLGGIFRMPISRLTACWTFRNQLVGVVEADAHLAQGAAVFIRKLETYAIVLVAV
jgi:hypothetical protein